MFGRHFEEKDEIISMLSRKSIDTLKVCRTFLRSGLNTTGLTWFLTGTLPRRRQQGRMDADQEVEADVGDRLVICFTQSGLRIPLVIHSHV